MALPSTALNAAVGGITGNVTYIALTNGGTELSGGSYARVPVTWGAASSGAQKMSADLTFNVPAGATVDGWAGYSAASGGTSYGGSSVTSTGYASAGQYVLQAASTGYTIS